MTNLCLPNISIHVVMRLDFNQERAKIPKDGRIKGFFVRCRRTYVSNNEKCTNSCHKKI